MATRDPFDMDAAHGPASAIAVSRRPHGYSCTGGSLNKKRAFYFCHASGLPGPGWEKMVRAINNPYSPPASSPDTQNIMPLLVCCPDRFWSIDWGNDMPLLVCSGGHMPTSLQWDCACNIRCVKPFTYLMLLLQFGRELSNVGSHTSWGAFPSW